MKDKKELLSKIKDAALPELLDLIPQLITGNVGMILPVIGKTYLNYKSNEKIETQIDELKERLDKLESKEQICIIENSIRVFLMDTVKTYESEYVELYVIDGFKIYLNYEDDIINYLSVLNYAWQNNDYNLKLWVNENIYIMDNAIVFHLVEHQTREEIDELLENIKEIIEEEMSISWIGPFKKIVFF